MKWLSLFVLKTSSAKKSDSSENGNIVSTDAIEIYKSLYFFDISAKISKNNCEKKTK